MLSAAQPNPSPVAPALTCPPSPEDDLWGVNEGENTSKTVSISAGNAQPQRQSFQQTARPQQPPALAINSKLTQGLITFFDRLTAAIFGGTIGVLAHLAKLTVAGVFFIVGIDVAYGRPSTMSMIITGSIGGLLGLTIAAITTPFVFVWNTITAIDTGWKEIKESTKKLISDIKNSIDIFKETTVALNNTLVSPIQNHSQGERTTVTIEGPPTNEPTNATVIRPTTSTMTIQDFLPSVPAGALPFKLDNDNKLTTNQTATHNWPSRSARADSAPSATDLYKNDSNDFKHPFSPAKSPH